MSRLRYLLLGFLLLPVECLSRRRPPEGSLPRDAHQYDQDDDSGRDTRYHHGPPSPIGSRTKMYEFNLEQLDAPTPRRSRSESAHPGDRARRRQELFADRPTLGREDADARRTQRGVDGSGRMATHAELGRLEDAPGAYADEESAKFQESEHEAPDELPQARPHPYEIPSEGRGRGPSHQVHASILDRMAPYQQDEQEPVPGERWPRHIQGTGGGDFERRRNVFEQGSPMAGRVSPERHTKGAPSEQSTGGSIRQKVQQYEDRAVEQSGRPVARSRIVGGDPSGFKRTQEMFEADSSQAEQSQRPPSSRGPARRLHLIKDLDTQDEAFAAGQGDDQAHRQSASSSPPPSRATGETERPVTQGAKNKAFLDRIANFQRTFDETYGFAEKTDRQERRSRSVPESLGDATSNSVAEGQMPAESEPLNEREAELAKKLEGKSLTVTEIIQLVKAIVQMERATAAPSDTPEEPEKKKTKKLKFCPDGVTKDNIRERLQDAFQLAEDKGISIKSVFKRYVPCLTDKEVGETARIVVTNAVRKFIKDKKYKRLISLLTATEDACQAVFGRYQFSIAAETLEQNSVLWPLCKACLLSKPVYEACVKVGQITSKRAKSL